MKVRVRVVEMPGRWMMGVYWDWEQGGHIFGLAMGPWCFELEFAFGSRGHCEMERKP